MNLSLYRRHTDQCKFRSRGAGYTKCFCPIYCDGWLNGRRFRRSVGLTDWARAVRRVERWEAEPQQALAPPSVQRCVQAFLNDCQARHLAQSTITSYSKALNAFSAWYGDRGVPALSEINLESLGELRAQRMTAASTQRKEIDILRTFFDFSVKRGWMAVNLARDLKKPVDDRKPTMPFGDDEIRKIVDACDRIENNYWQSAARARVRAKALVLLLLYSGLRISDAVKLERSALDNYGRLNIRTMKTGVPLYVRLNQDTIDALSALPQSGPYFFWSGRSKLKTAIGSAQRTIDRLMRLAGIKGHAHRFRDTFAVGLLRSGADLRTVQLLLGHESIRTTEKSYAPFVPEFQMMLDDATAKLAFGAG